jgi:hypothetical protein
MSRKLIQPDEDAQMEAQSLVHNGKDYAEVRGKRYGVRWLRNGTRDKITRVVLRHGNDGKQSCQCAALMVLNGFWANKLLYWIVWRWFYYVKQYGEEELTGLLVLGKKKVPQEAYFTNTILLTGLKDTNEMMKKTEVSTFLQGQATAVPGTSPKNTAG